MKRYVAERFEPIPLVGYSYLWAVWDHKRGRLVKVGREVVYYGGRECAQIACDVFNRPADGVAEDRCHAELERLRADVVRLRALLVETRAWAAGIDESQFTNPLYGVLEAEIGPLL